jgi:hypothetical protein
MRNLVVATVLVAGTTAVPAFAAEYYADIRPLIERKCVMCHSESSVSFSFEDGEHTYDFRQAIASAVTERRMPPWLAEAGHQEYVEDISLTASERRLFSEWADDGYPKGAARDRRPAQPVYAPFSAELVVEVMPNDFYMPNARRVDDYRCFVLDWPVSEPTYVTGFRAVPGNLKVAHHLVLFAAQAEVAARYKALERQEEGKGYECFGGPVPDRFEDENERAAYEKRYPKGIEELNNNSFWLAQWAPGTDGHAFPVGTGIRMYPGMVLIVQMHYYSAFAPGESDSGTTMEFTLGDQVSKPAFTLPQSRFEWLNGERNGSMVVPPGQRRTYVDSMNLERLRDMAAAVTDTPASRIDALEVHSANLHMHSYGSSGVISLIDKHGLEETLLSVPRWNLNWQRNFTLSKPKVVGRDEFATTEIRVQCTYENPKVVPVYGGFGSDEEMCFNFSYVAVVVGDGDVEKRAP